MTPPAADLLWRRAIPARQGKLASPVVSITSFGQAEHTYWDVGGFTIAAHLLRPTPAGGVPDVEARSPLWRTCSQSDIPVSAISSALVPRAYQVLTACNF